MDLVYFDPESIHQHDEDMLCQKQRITQEIAEDKSLLLQKVLAAEWKCIGGAIKRAYNKYCDNMNEQLDLVKFDLELQSNQLYIESVTIAQIELVKVCSNERMRQHLNRMQIGDKNLCIQSYGKSLERVGEPVYLYGEYQRQTMHSNGHPEQVTHCTIVNNGYTAQAHIPSKELELKQFHFHTPSEHTIDSRAYEIGTENGTASPLPTANKISLRKKENEPIAEDFLQGANVWNAEKAIMTVERVQLENDITYAAHHVEELICERSQLKHEADDVNKCNGNKTEYCARSSSNKFFEGGNQMQQIQMPDTISIELKSVY
eukprot:693258_1